MGLPLNAWYARLRPRPTTPSVLKRLPSKISATFNISNNPRAIVIEVYLLRRWLKNKLPFGNYPRLLLAWTSTEAVRTQSRELLLGRSLAEFIW